MMDLPPGTHAIVDQAVEEAAQNLFAAADLPLARSGELLAALQGPAVRAVLEARIEQIVKHGHDATHDADLPIGWLPRHAREMMQMALDCLHPVKPDLPVARRRVARAAALCLAAIDRIDVEMTRGDLK